MAVVTNEGGSRYDWREIAKKGLKASAIAALGFLTVRFDLLGDFPHHRSKAEVRAALEEKVMARYRSEGAAGRFSLLLLQDQSPGQGIFVGALEGGNSVLGIVPRTLHGIKSSVGYEKQNRSFGQDCLMGSAYDTTPSEIRGRAHGDISSVATVNVVDDETVVYPAASNAAPLRFAQGETPSQLLIPADGHTRSTLEAYGCNPKIGV